MGDWPSLTRELDAWAAAGRRATIWWRDDDTTAPGPNLARVLELSARHGVPVALAVIPAAASEALDAWLADAPARPRILQHGYAHQNHASGARRKWELGDHRPAADVLGELARGWMRMNELFGARWLPVMVPPWNRIAPAIERGLPGLGFRGVSAYGPRDAACETPGLRTVNTHVDIMRWTAPRGFLGEKEALGLLVGHLHARRMGKVDADEPTGLLTHHLAHDPECWAFLDRLLMRLAAHSAVRPLDAGDVFPAGQSATKEIQ